MTALIRATSVPFLDVYRENGYEQMMHVQMNALSQAEDDFASTTQEVVLNDDGTLTFFYVREFETDEPTRAIKLSASAKKVTEKDGKTESGEEETVEIAFTVEKENDDGETTVSAEPMEYESIGVRVDQGDDDGQGRWKSTILSNTRSSMPKNSSGRTTGSGSSSSTRTARRPSPTRKG